MTETVRVGFVGAGLIARSHAHGLAAAPGASVVAVHDIDRERAVSFATDHAGTADAAVGSLEAVVAACDAVYVCTWTSAHPAAVSAAAGAGRAVFCEKPLAVDLATASAMTAEVAEAGVVNQVGLVLRRSPSFRWLHRRVNDPTSGPLMNIVFRDDQYLPTQGMYGSTWRDDPSRAGAGTLLEHSIHDLDLLRWLMGPIASVIAVTGSVHGIDGIEDQASVVLTARSGAQAALTSVWHEVLSRPSQRRVEVFCRDAVVTLAGDWWGPVSCDDGAAVVELGGEELGAAVDDDGLGTNPDAAFVEAVRGGRPAFPDFATALEAHRLADAAYRSAADGGRPIAP
ncbi:MAG: Gfo/Idh/MocA family protein [Acidimicrobiales bacterium]